MTVLCDIQTNSRLALAHQLPACWIATCQHRTTQVPPTLTWGASDQEQGRQGQGQGVEAHCERSAD